MSTKLRLYLLFRRRRDVFNDIGEVTEARSMDREYEIWNFGGLPLFNFPPSFFPLLCVKSDQSLASAGQYHALYLALLFI